MRKSFTEDGLQFAWDATSLTMASECPRKYQLSILEGWKPLSTSHHLLFGGWYATALEHFYKHVALGKPIEDALEEVVHEALVSTWINGEAWNSNDSAKSRYTLIRSIIAYIDEFGDESEAGIKTMILENGQPACELSFSFELADGILYCGHIDRVVEMHGVPYVMDQKTTGTTITQHFFSKFTPDIQMTGYTLAGKIVLKIPVRGVIIDGAQIAVNFTKFLRGFTYRTQEEIAEWIDDALSVIRRTQGYLKDGYYPKNTTACGNFGACQFRSVCGSDPRMRQNELESNFFKAELWDPLERR